MKTIKLLCINIFCMLMCIPGMCQLSRSLYAKSILGENGTYDEIREIVYLNSGRMLLFGNSDNPLTSNGDAWLAALDSVPDFSPGPTLAISKYLGTDSLEDAISIAVNANRDAVFIGGMSNINAQPNDNDMFIAKLNPDGDVIWANTYGGNDFDDFYKVLATPDGGALGIGATNSFTGLQRAAYVFKVDSDGQVVWTKVISGNFAQYFFDGASYPGGGYVLSGSSFKSGASFDVLVTRIAENGNIIWSKTFGDSLSDLGYKVVPVVSGNDTTIFVSGASTSKTVAESADALLLSLKSNGQINWVKTYGDEDFNRAQGVTYGKSVSTGANALLLYGYSSAVGSTQRLSLFMEVNPTSGDLNRVSTVTIPARGESSAVYQAIPEWGGANGFWACGYEYNGLDQFGQGFLTPIEIGSGFGCSAEPFTFTTINQTYRVADLNQVVSGGFNEPFEMNSVDGNRNAILLQCFEAKTRPTLKVDLLSISPNPIKSGQILELKLSELESGAKIVKMFDVAGKQVLSKNLTSKVSLFDIKLPKGMYFIQVQGSNQLLIPSRKIIVE